nr:hypothetical protein [Kiritimatiellia bacterium]
MPRSDDFTTRHIGSNPDHITIMLEKLGLTSLNELIDETIPSSIKSEKAFSLPAALD